MKPVDEYNDIYDENRCLTGKLHLRGTPWNPGEFGLVVYVWVYDGRGHLLLTRRQAGHMARHNAQNHRWKITFHRWFLTC